MTMPYLEDLDGDSVAVSEDWSDDSDVLDLLSELDEADGWDADDAEDEDGEDWGDEGESLGERRRRRRRYRRRYRGRGRSQRRPSSFRPVQGARGATVRTPTGSAQVRFSKPLATVESVNARIKEVKKEIGRNTAAIARVDKQLDKNTAILDKKIRGTEKRLDKTVKQNQQMMLLPLLMQSTPKPTKIVFGDAADTTKVTDIEYEKTDNMLPLVLMMSGGFGGEGGDSQSNMLMILALTGAFDSKK